MINCKKCGELFEPRSSRNTVCPKCARKHTLNENQLRRIKKGNKLKSPKKPIYQQMIYGYGCQCAICGWSALKDVYGFTNEINKKAYDNNLRINENVILTTGLNIHHIVEVSKGGNDTFDNLITLCPNCHKLAHMGLFDDKVWERVKFPEEIIISNYLEVKNYVDEIRDYIKNIDDLKIQYKKFQDEMRKYATSAANRSTCWSGIKEEEHAI